MNENFIFTCSTNTICRPGLSPKIDPLGKIPALSLTDPAVSRTDRDRPYKKKGMEIYGETANTTSGY